MVITRDRRRCAVEDGDTRLDVVPGTISLDEWRAHIASNPVLTRVRLAANEDDRLRTKHPARLTDRRTDGWLFWVSGEIHADGPDPALHASMLGIARTMGARVRHDVAACRLADTASPRIRPLAGERADVPRTPEEEEALAGRRATQALVVAGTIACVASVMWLMQA